MVAMPKPLEVTLETVKFTFGGLFTFDVWQSEAEMSPVLMMAYFYKLANGKVSVASLWVNEGTEKAPHWIDIRLPKFQIALIEKAIAAGVLKEQEEDSRNVREVAGGFV